MPFKRVVFCSVEKCDVNAYSAEWDEPFDAAAYKAATGRDSGPGVRVRCSGCSAKADVMGQEVQSIRKGLLLVHDHCSCGHDPTTTFYTSGDGTDGWHTWPATDRAGSRDL